MLTREKLIKPFWIVVVLFMVMLLAYLLYLKLLKNREVRISTQNTVERSTKKSNSNTISDIASSDNVSPKGTVVVKASIDKIMERNKESVSDTRVVDVVGEKSNINTSMNDYIASVSFTYDQPRKNAVIDTNDLDQDMLNAGTPFYSDLDSLRYLAVGELFKLEVVGEKFDAVIESKKNAKHGKGYLEVKLEEAGFASRMTIYYGNEKIIGKIYNKDNSYIFEHNYSVGYIMTIYEYKKLKDALNLD